MTYEQQQLETVTTTTTQSNLHKLLSVQELILSGECRSENAVDSQMYSLVEASGDQDQYFVRSS